MLKTTLFLLLTLVGIQTFAQEHLLGKFDSKALQQAPFNEWFQPSHDAYLVKKNYLKDLQISTKTIQIKVFLGTWCGDSKREVPQFLKILESQNIKPAQVEWLALGDSDSDLYKQSPEHQEQGMAVFRVPTFIILKDGKELGRIVESPVISLENDLARILNQEKYKPNYAFGSSLLMGIEAKQLSLSKMNLAELADEYRNRVQNSSELNGLGYILLKRKQDTEALAIFKLNALLFPNVANVFDSLAEAYTSTGQLALAKETWQKVLVLSPNNDRAIKMLKSLTQ
jgi:thiol-disulfide isomerase/thioredoxin